MSGGPRSMWRPAEILMAALAAPQACYGHPIITISFSMRLTLCYGLIAHARGILVSSTLLPLAPGLMY